MRLLKKARDALDEQQSLYDFEYTGLRPHIPPGPTRHPIVSESDVTWFIWSYAAALFAFGMCCGALLVFFAMLWGIR